MTRHVYALLVGIDNYPPPTPPLRGCVNDINAIESYLRGRLASEGFQLHLKALKNQEANRQTIIDSFRQHLCQAGQEDVALFYYSGHGSQEPTPPDFWHIEPDHLDETLVCWDSRTSEGWDLADKELAKLIAEVAEKEPHITIVLDCCHSGSGTRNPLLETGIRRVPADQRRRPLESFLFSLQELPELSTAFRSPAEHPSGWTIPKGRHVLLAACRDNEEAKEYYADGQSRGAFSFFLLETLKRANVSLSYRDLFKCANALVKCKVTAQSPQLEATALRDLEQPFLGGAIAPRHHYFTASYHRDYGWVIDGGAIHGIPPMKGAETTHLALFHFDSPAEQLQQLAQSLGEAEVTEVLPHLSRIQISGREDFSSDLTFKAVVTSLPLPPLGVRLEGDVGGIEFVRQALQVTEPDGSPSLYVREVRELDLAEFRVLAREGEYLITRPGDDQPLVAQVKNFTPDSARCLVVRLEHIARWTTIAELASPANSRIRPDAISMEIYQGEQLLEGRQIRLEYELDTNEKWKQPTFSVRLTNTSDKSLYCALLDLTERYAVETGFFESGGIWLNPREEAWALQKQPLYASVPKGLWEQGITEVQDILKLIVSTAEFDATLLEQDNLDLPRLRSAGRSKGIIIRSSVLNRLMNRVQMRAIRPRPDEDQFFDDWVTSQIVLTTVRPLNSTPLPKEGEGITLGAGVKLLPHDGLQAKARLTTISQSTRDLGNLIVPPILREDPEVTQTFKFTASRGSDPGLSVLELTVTEAQAPTIEKVTPDNPLRLSVTASLAEGEYLLPIACDGEFFLPLGIARTAEQGIEIELKCLPAPVSEGKKSLGGSIRIFFQKVIGEKLGFEFPYPILAVAEVGEDDTVGYEADNEKVKARVAEASKILLFIHGIIGDTRSLVPSAWQAKIEDKPIREHYHYDLVLTFDYENLNTPIREIAQQLKSRLADVGLAENHGKTLHIVAHSMGGLVSRSFIEQEGGDRTVQHLIMLGTPNGGSPWSTVQDWATVALTVALNSLSSVALPVKVLGTLVATVEAFDISLDQMKPGSEFLTSLKDTPDPGIPYTIVAGNTSLIQPPDAETASRIRQLFHKVVRGIVEFPFFGEPNDIAVSISSIENIPHQFQVQEVACNHLVYFNHPAGLEGLGWALEQANIRTENIDEIFSF